MDENVVCNSTLLQHRYLYPSFLYKKKNRVLLGKGGKQSGYDLGYYFVWNALFYFMLYLVKNFHKPFFLFSRCALTKNGVDCNLWRLKNKFMGSSRIIDFSLALADTYKANFSLRKKSNFNMHTI